MKLIIYNIFLIFLTLNVSAQVGMITDIEVEQRDDNSGIVDVSFRLVGVPNISYHILVDVSFDGGNTFQRILPEFINGAVGHVYPTNHTIHINWDGLASFPGTFNQYTRLRIGAQKATVNDIDGNQYKTILVGNQFWMAENLKVTRFNNGDSLRKYFNLVWGFISSDVYTVYPFGFIDGLESEEEVKNAYGLLYNGYVVIDDREVCPTGWHIPSYEDWEVLISYLSDNYGWSNTNETDGLGNKLKSCHQLDSPFSNECAVDVHPRWNSHNTHFGSDELGFSVLPAGYCNVSPWHGLGRYAYFWSSSQIVQSMIYKVMSFDSGRLQSKLSLSGNYGKRMGMSIRCVKNIDN